LFEESQNSKEEKETILKTIFTNSFICKEEYLKESRETE
jgi:hypothetical protein